MTISTTTSRTTYNGNGSTTVFPIPFKFLANTDIRFYVGGVLKTLTTDYTITGAGSDSGGTLTALSAPASGTGNVVLFRDPDLLQTTAIPANDPFPAKSVETALDKLTMIVQRAFDKISRTLSFPDSDGTSISTVLPDVATRGNKYLFFNADGSTGVSTGTADNGALQTSLSNTSNTALGDALIGVQQPYSGASARTQHTKNAETLSITDFATTQQALDALAGLRKAPPGSYLGATATNYSGVEMEKGASFSAPIVPLPFTAAAGSDNFLKSIRNTSKSGYDVYNAAFPSVTNFDVFQSVIEVKAGSTAENVTAVAGYVWQSDTSPSNAVCLFGNGAVVANSGSCWGINTLLTDNSSRVVGALTGITLIGAELDFNVMNTATTLIGISVGGNSLSQPTNPQAFIVNSLGTGIKWKTGFSTIDGAVDSTTGAAVKVGADAAAGANIPSQRILLGWRDGSSNAQAGIIQMSSGFMSFNSSGAFNGVTLPSGSYWTTAGQGLLVNGNIVASDRKTGWALPTGTISRATFDQSTVTLPQLAQRLAALISDLYNVQIGA